jgi:hypothetical protein
MTRPDSTDVDRAIDTRLNAHRSELIELAQKPGQDPNREHPPTGGELAGQRYVQAQLELLGAEVDVFTPEPVDRTPQVGRAGQGGSHP